MHGDRGRRGEVTARSGAIAGETQAKQMFRRKGRRRRRCGNPSLLLFLNSIQCRFDFRLKAPSAVGGRDLTPKLKKNKNKNGKKMGKKWKKKKKELRENA
jgi:hypothetical protein